MNADKTPYYDLQEIVFWQALNKQLNELHVGSHLQSDEKFDSLQRFCLECNLFHRISGSIFADEVQLSLVTDFQKVQMITHGASIWCDTLRDVIKKSVILNIDNALTDAFEAMRDLEGEVGLSIKLDEDDDPELFSVIDEFNNLTEKQNRNIDRIAEKLFTLKSESINSIRDLIPNNYLTIRNDQLRLEFANIKNRDEIATLYVETYYEPCLNEFIALSSAADVFNDMELLNFFDQFDSDKAVKPAIKKFIEDERNLLNTWNKVISEHIENVKVKLNQRFDYEIPICDLRPFHFLEWPLPLV